MAKKLIVLLVIVVSINNIESFNLSPKPNLVFSEPLLNTYQPKAQSSNFGFSLNLRKSSLFIGAPKAQSSLESQRLINETGVVYKCRLDTTECLPYNVDTLGNIKDGGNSENKNNQLFGYTMDGHTSDEDRLVICAPKLMADINDNDRFLHGVCYSINNTIDQQPARPYKITPLRDLRMQMDYSVFNYIYGQQGFSVHLTENSEEILMGAPGIHAWKGTVIRNRLVKEDFGSMSRRDVSRRKRSNFEYFVNDVPNPAVSEISDDSYFGYAVSSGYFDDRVPDKLLYVASAPQSNLQRGEVRIFEIVQLNTIETKIKTIFQFQSQYIGEYFGYALLTEDFNGDGLPDLAISAPYHKRDPVSFDNGVVYIYHNGKNIHFSERKILSSEYLNAGKFGMTLGKIGDLNRDGYNDLAVGAPFEDNGAVYIFLGGSDGLSTEAVQKLEPAVNDLTTPPQWFGFGISKGVDIDNNGFNDIAIGSPNTENVYIFKSYPVLNIKSKLTLSKNVLAMEDTSLKATICYHYEVKSVLQLTDIEFAFDLKLDEQDGRAIIDKRNYVVTISDRENCWSLDIFIKSDLSKIFKPIEIQFIHSLTPSSSATDNEFCATCVFLDPKESKTTAVKVAFSTGCAETVCMADLQIEGTPKNIQMPYIIGSSRTINIEYVLRNLEETAYLTRAEFEIPSFVTFQRVPSACDKTNNTVLHCNIGSSGILKNQKDEKLTISLDTTALVGDHIRVMAQISSSSSESNEIDNQNVVYIQLKEFSEVEVFGKSSKRQISLLDDDDFHNIRHTFEIHNKGPTNLNNLHAIISIPVSYRTASGKVLNIMKVNNMTITGKNENHILDIVVVGGKSFTDNIALSGIGVSPHNDVDTASQNSDFETFHNQHNNDDVEYNLNMIHRRRRDLVVSDYNKYTQRVVNHSQSRKRRSVNQENDDLFNNLPVNRTVFFNCDNQGVTCIHAKFNISNLFPGHQPAEIVFQFGLDMSVYDNIFDDYLNMFAIQPVIDLVKVPDNDYNSLKVVSMNPYTIIYQQSFVVKSTPIWIYIVSSLGGLAILLISAFALYKCGFFKRQIKEDLEEEKRRSMALSGREAAQMLPDDAE